MAWGVCKKHVKQIDNAVGKLLVSGYQNDGYSQLICFSVTSIL